MSLIDESYFVGDIALPNLEEIINTFKDNIERYEKEVLIDLLGRPLYNDFMAGLAAPTVEQKWIDLRDGADFTFEWCGHTVNEHWNGLINDDKVSVISYYIYYKHRYENLSTTTSINDVQGLPENATKVNDVRKMAYAWKQMLELYGELPCTWRFNKYDSTYWHYTDKPSAYNFLLANKDDYSNWLFEGKARLNEFGI
jgi:hypothetical protein